MLGVSFTANSSEVSLQEFTFISSFEILPPWEHQKACMKFYLLMSSYLNQS